ncbi:dihydrodipicolinate synthase family protein [Ideonella sp. YS5]|uniref:dihydrodipicolinate synthase family protein n=1 Tax=Ideonella sp. YS5 TaxID=3453714 RepID=UPI003EEC91FB
MLAPPAWLKGLFAVLPTPMVAGGGLDLDSLDRVVDYYLEGGAAGLVPVSVAGEGDLLDETERRHVMERVVLRARARVPVIAGILADGTEAALAQVDEAAQCGVDGLLVKPSGDGPPAIVEHFRAIGRSAGLPIVLLDYPPATPPLPVELIALLAECVPEVAGIKLEDQPTDAKMARLRAVVGQRVRIFGGLSGAHALRELEHGADGFFTGCPQPELLVQTMARFRDGDIAGALAAFESLREVIARERQRPAAMIAQRKAILRELGVLRDDATRSRLSA